MTQYSPVFFQNRQALTESSAKEVLSILWPIIKPTSVVDIGCATGTWLIECKRQGARVYGIDGPWVPIDQRLLTSNEFLEHDLSLSVPEVAGRFDLALCIELAEHLDAATGSDLVRLLTKTADTILFSAAIKGQGGTGHINEQPQSYWHAQFDGYGFECFDVIRPAIWQNHMVNVIYKQNMLVYAQRGSSTGKRIASAPGHSSRISTKFELDRVHPDLYLRRTRPQKPTLRGMARHYLRAALQRKGGND